MKEIKGKVIARGARRTVFELDNGNVMKIPVSKYGYRSNAREVNVYKRCGKRLKRHLGKIVRYGDRYEYLIMKKYDRRFPKSNRFFEELKRLKRLFTEKGIYPYDIVSNRGKANYQNLRLDNDGRIIIIDYGNFIFKKPALTHKKLDGFSQPQ
ncbi:hypothetical protein [Cohnella candidum]|uniref:Protein kinase domain-containing protein n=1 Tax=Cohnella candidum TaxID=2674991 RepID=A0A3G3JTR6_9BACL|nr:hypothetical protein [Cohnella candidum]AYQ71615.1 hypothetical protein EAV92_02865 [Cohnella candidum]